MKKLLILIIFLLLGIGGYFYFNQQPKSRHYAERVKPIQFLVIHSFDESPDEMIRRLDELEISTHYLIDQKGKIIQLVADDKVAWHAGKSYWKGITGLNAYSIGIELESPSVGQTPFSEVQIQSFKKLAQKLMKKYNIPPENVVGHSDIAPTRKVDPGKMFPWKELGLGPKDIEQGEIPEKLVAIGYDITNLKAAVLAYNRHFHPELVPTDDDIKHLEENLAKMIKDENPVQQ